MSTAQTQTPSARSELEEKDDEGQHQVVLDIEDRYSIWPVEEKIPLYWRKEGFIGTKAKCLEYIEKVWTDMRPRSLKIQMEAWQKEKERTGDPWKAPPVELQRLLHFLKQQEVQGFNYFHMPQKPTELITRLMQPQPIELIRYGVKKNDPSFSLERLVEMVREFHVVHVRFIWTMGGTELIVAIDKWWVARPNTNNNSSNTNNPDLKNAKVTKGESASFEIEEPVSQDEKSSDKKEEESAAAVFKAQGRVNLDFCPLQVTFSVGPDGKGRGWVDCCPWWKTAAVVREEERRKRSNKGKQEE